jgi:hypothetical protein
MFELQIALFLIAIFLTMFVARYLFMSITHPSPHPIMPRLLGTIACILTAVGLIYYSASLNPFETITKTNNYNLADITLIKKNVGESTQVDISRYNLLVTSGEHQKITKMQANLKNSEIIINKTNKRYSISEIRERADIKEPTFVVEQTFLKDTETKKETEINASCYLLVPQESSEKIIQKGQNGN